MSDRNLEKTMDEPHRRQTENVDLRLTIDNFTKIAEVCDALHINHQERVSQLCCAMGEKLGLNFNTLKGLRVSAVLHDLGMVHVPEEILSKTSKLTDAELALVRNHAQTGYDMLKDADFPWPVAEIILQHHEHFDGSGYPNGLVDDQIRDEAKIICVADAVEAIISARSYHPAGSLQKAIEEMEKGSGSFYDPDAVDAFLKLISDGKLTVNGWV